MEYPIVFCASDLVKMIFFYESKSSISREELDEFALFVDENLTEKGIVHTIFYNDEYLNELGENFSETFLVDENQVSLVNESEYKTFGFELKKSYEGFERNIMEEVIKDYISKSENEVDLTF